MRIDRLLFAFFLVSGFCSLAYEVIWLRLAMAGFGVTTPLVSIVLSVFMGGLGIGSWLGGRIARALEPRAGAPLRGYAIAELLIGISGLTMPFELERGRALLARLGDQVAWGSGEHHLAAGLWVTLAFLPFCTAMGATFPLGIAALRSAEPERSERSFSYLYGANVLGATLGALISAFVLIELFGFRGTGRAVAVLNGLVAITAFAASWVSPRRGAPVSSPSPAPAAPSPADRSGAAAPWLLFTTGLVSMAMEVVWVRQFSPFLGTVVYAFASILAVYLGATFLGAIAYRRWVRSRAEESGQIAVIWSAAFASALLPLLFADPRLTSAKSFGDGLLRLAPGIAPFCTAIGILTPMLVDRWSRGDPRRAGGVYAMNIIGCVLGPLLASFVLLPWLGERASLVALCAPLAAVAAIVARTRPGFVPYTTVAAATALAAVLALSTKDFATIYMKPVVRRDYAATVIAARSYDGMLDLLVNGTGMTRKTSIAKVMVHFPLAHLSQPPRHVLVVCFGMGTSFRSAVSWGVPTTAVDLIPSVPALFSEFHSDAQRVLSTPSARVVVDDGRRFLERSTEQFDLVTIDPPPPVEAAGSSLLYSREFYEVIERRLAPGGIVQQWIPGGDPEILASVAKALQRTFTYVRAFHSIHGWGIHFLASMEPIPVRDAASLAGRLPREAAADLVEWLPNASPVGIFAKVLGSEFAPSSLVRAAPDVPGLTDDRPVNEYFFLRWLAGKRKWVQPG